MPRPTLKDIAAEAGVSISAVSYALNDASHVRLADQTRARIRRIAQEMGYTPNAAARSLRARTSRTVGLVLTKPLRTLRYAAITQGVGTALAEHGFRLTVIRDPEGASVLEDCRSGVLDGLLFVGHDDIALPDTLAAAAADGSAPLVTLDCGMPAPDAPFSSVDFDYAQGTRQMVDHLVGSGITTVLHLRPEVSSRAERERRATLMHMLGASQGMTLQVVSTGLDDHGLAASDLAASTEEWAAGHLARQVSRLEDAIDGLDAPDHRIAVLCSWGTDVEAALAALHRSGRADITVAALAAGWPRVGLWPRLVYSSLPLEHAGAEAARLLLAELRPDATHEHLQLSPELELPPI